MTLTYKEQLLHPNWQRKRLEVFESAGWRCENCCAESKTLHCHHKQYIKGRMAWEYDRDELACLCEECHASAHAALTDIRAVLGALNPDDLSNLAVLLKGWFESEALQGVLSSAQLLSADAAADAINAAWDAERQRVQQKPEA